MKGFTLQLQQQGLFKRAWLTDLPPGTTLTMISLTARFLFLMIYFHLIIRQIF